jgi:lipoyl(octanoyl) transferase
MFCRLFIDPPASPSWNMALDETLLESAADGSGFSLRFYRWQQPTLSLGYFQQYDDRWQHATSRNCPVVRRATGGGAILHDHEITYCITVPPGHRLALKHLSLYQSVHSVLIEALAVYGINASLCLGEARQKEIGDCRYFRGHGHKPIVDRVAMVGENETVPFAAPKKGSKEPFLCFQRRSPGDVLLAEVKIAGSAQRRHRGAVLQHGSLLLSRSPAAPELPGIEEVAEIDLSFNQFVQTWLSILAKALSLDLQQGKLSESEQRRVEVLAWEKYDSTTWTQKQGGKMHAERTASRLSPPL